MPDSDTILQTIINVLNDAYQADPAAIHALMANRVRCNKALAHHPTVVVRVEHYGASSDSETHFNVGALGLINGIAEALCGDKVAMKWQQRIIGKDEDENWNPRFLGFCAYDPVQVVAAEGTEPAEAGGN